MLNKPYLVPAPPERPPSSGCSKRPPCWGERSWTAKNWKPPTAHRDGSPVLFNVSEPVANFPLLPTDRVGQLVSYSPGVRLLLIEYTMKTKKSWPFLKFSDWSVPPRHQSQSWWREGWWWRPPLLQGCPQPWLRPTGRIQKTLWKRTGLKGCLCGGKDPDKILKASWVWIRGAFVVNKLLTLNIRS